MSAAAQTARMVLRAPEARAPVPIPVPERPRPAPVPVSQPSEPAEQEADRIAQAALAQPPRPRVQRSPPLASLSVTRTPTPAGPVPVPYPNVGLDADGGRPLPTSLRRDMEPRFGADFSAVRIHTGDRAARASRRLNAAAFTAGSHIAFGRGRFQPERAEGRRLIAHELTHTVQQRGATQPPTVRRSVDTTVRTRSEPRVMRLGVQDALDYFADKAAHLPGFTMLTLLLGFNPVNLRRVERSAPNLLRALVQMLPGGALITQALDNHGIVERVANWVAAQLSALGDLGASIRDAIDRFLDSLSWTDIFDLGGLWERARSIVATPIARIVAFARGLVVDIVDFIKDAILRPLAALAEGTRGYPLLKAVLGFDPITGDPVERSPTTLIGGFMKLIGQEEVWLNLQRANAVPRAWAWFQGALEGLVGFVRQIPTLYVNAFRALGLIDIVVLPRAFAKVIGVFAGFYGRFFRWAGGTVVDLLEIIFAAVAPAVMPYLRRAGAAFVSVLRNPIAFGRNLVLALKTGFTRFAANFLTHLTAGIIDWLTGSLPGVHIPRSLSLQEILKFVLSVLGLTWANLRAKLVRKVGEPAVVAMEKGFEIVKKLVTEGPVAAWEQLKASLADLKQMAIDAIVAMVTEFVVVKAIPKLIALFIPGPGFITAAIAIYDTIMTFIRQLGRIAALVKSYLDAFMAIASGVIDTAAGRIEAAAARYLSLIVSILAGMLGFGKVANRVRAVLERIRAPIDRAMDKVVDWVLGMARKVAGFVAGKPQDRVTEAGVAVEGLMRRAGATVATVESALPELQRRFGLASLRLVRERRGSYRVEATVNPSYRGQPGVLFTAQELAAIDRLGRQWAAQIKAKGLKAKYLADKKGLLAGERAKVQTGDLVEATSVDEVAAFAPGLTVYTGSAIQLMDASGGPIGGTQAELDVIIFGRSTGVEVLSAKFKRKQFRPTTDRTNLSHYIDMPLDPPGIVAYAQANFGTNRRYVDIAGALVVHAGGREPLAAFRARYLAGVVVSTVTVIPLTPGPEDVTGIQLVATEADLLDAVIKVVDAHL